LGQLEDDLATFLKSLRAQQLQEQRPLNFRDRATMLCPTKRNFNFVVQHTLICTKCGETSVSKELFRYFSLDIHSREVLAAMRLRQHSILFKQEFLSSLNPVIIFGLLWSFV